MHGDAKLANFCFSKNNKVAAVDFQYVGGGCGVKDVAYFLGSCFNANDLSRYDDESWNFYFTLLAELAEKRDIEIDTGHLVESWRELIPLAWADFHRFVKGWKPGHWKVNSYSEQITQRAIEKCLPSK